MFRAMSKDHRNHQIAMAGGNWIPPDYWDKDEPKPEQEDNEEEE